MSRTPNYVLMEEHTVHGSGDYRTLPAGAFVRPVKWEYLPKSFQETWRDAESYWVCYTRFGLTPIPKEKVRRV